MKRINEATQKPFKLGDRRADGMAFYKYTNKLKKDGTFIEIWLQADKLAANLERARAKKMEKYARVSGRKPRGYSRMTKEEQIQIDMKDQDLTDADRDWMSV